MESKQWVDGTAALAERPCRVITIEATERPQARRLRVAAYARVSSNSEDQENSFAAQNTYYTALLTSTPEWEMVDIYADEGITGTSADKRDDFQRLMADCRRGLIDRIVVKSISRFARNTMECLEAIRELKDMGVSVFFEEQGIDTAEMSSEMVTAVHASFAQIESVNISKNMRWSYQKRMQSGIYVPCNLPYGFIRIDGQISPHPEQARVVRRIFHEYLSGKSVERIAKELCEDGIPCKSGRVAWDTTAIRYIITNEKYKGDSLWQKYYTTDTLPFVCKRNRGEHDSFYAEGTHQGIVSVEEFDAANALIQRRAKQITPATQQAYPFRKKVYCGECGSVFRRRVVRGQIYWTCLSRAKKRVTTCTTPPVAEKALENAFLRFYYNLKHYPILQQMLSDLKTIRERRLLWREDVVELNKQISELSSQNQMLAELKKQSLIDPDIFIAQANELAQQLRETKLHKERLLSSISDPSITTTQKLLAVLEERPDFLDAFDPELFGELVDHIIVEDNEHIRFRLKNGLELPETIERTMR